MNDLSQTRVVVALLVMAGCPACTDYKPRFERIVKGLAKHGAPFVFYRPGKPIAPGTIPVIVADAASPDPTIQEFAEAHQVSAMPATILLTSNAAPVRLEGSLPDQEIYQLLASAVWANR